MIWRVYLLTFNDIQVSQCKSYGADVVTFGKDIQEAKDKATELARDKGLRYING